MWDIACKKAPMAEVLHEEFKMINLIPDVNNLVMLWCSTIYNGIVYSSAMARVECRSDFKLTIDISYLAQFTHCWLVMPYQLSQMYQISKTSTNDRSKYFDLPLNNVFNKIMPIAFGL